MALAREGVPMCIYSMGLAGATAPASVAGAVMQANAEILSAIVLFQLLRQGLGCIYVADTGVLDMRTGAYTAASPEAVLITQAMVGLARAYDLPVMATGLTGDANCFSSMSGSDAGVSVVTSCSCVPTCSWAPACTTARRCCRCPRSSSTASCFVSAVASSRA